MFHGPEYRTVFSRNAPATVKTGRTQFHKRIRYWAHRPARMHLLKLGMVLSFLVEVFLGAPLLATAILYIGTYLGFASVVVCGLDSVVGLLMLTFTLRTTGIFLLAKTLVFESWANGNETALTIAEVYFVGYAVTFILAAISVKIFRPHSAMERHFDSATCRAVAWLIFVLCMIASQLPATLSGGVWGAIRTYSALNVFCIPLAVGVSLAETPNRQYWHNLALLFLGVSLVLAVINTGKEAFVTPALAYILSLLIYGKISLKSFFSLLSVGTVLLFTIIGPYSDWIRNTGARDLVGMERVKVTLKGLATTLDPVQRRKILADLNDYRLQGQGRSLFISNVGYFGRLMSINEGYTLINATAEQGPLGAELVKEELSMLIPRFLAPWKSEVGTSFILSRFAGIQAMDSIEYVGIAFGPFPTYYTMGGLMMMPLIIALFTAPIFLAIRYIELAYPARMIRVGLLMLLWHTFAESTSSLGIIYSLLFLWCSLQTCHILTRSGTIRATGALVT